MSKAEIAKVEEQAIANVPVEIDFSADAGAGMENIDKDTLAIPFIKVLQSNSPECEPGKVEGAQQGLFFNTITKEVFKEIYVIPCAYQRRFIRWAPRQTGQGFKGEYLPTEIEAGKIEGMDNINGYVMFDVPKGANPFDDKGKPLYDVARDTRSHFVLYKSASGNWGAAIISMAGSLVKKSKRWMSLISGIELKDAKGRPFRPASYSHVYKLSSVKEEKAGNSWWSFDVTLAGKVDDADAYSKAGEFHKQIVAGDVKVQHVDDEPESGSATAETGAF